MLFSPPSRLQQLVRDAGGRLGPRDLFVKRVAAVGGDRVELTPSGAIAVNGVPRARPPLQCADAAATGVFPEGPSERGLTNIVIVKPAERLGVTVGDSPTDGRLTVVRTEEDLPAAGLLQPGDVIVSVNGVAGASAGADELRNELRAATGRVDIVVERAAGELGATASRVIPAGEIFVLGDCPARSTDSRTWGPLPVENVVARPVVRVWPLGRLGTIDASADLNPFRRTVLPGAGALDAIKRTFETIL